jgi:hypothetical protein
MGILKAHIHILAREHTAHPIRGQVLTLGQQALYANLQTVESVLRSYACPLPTLPSGLDTRSKFEDDNTNAETLFRLLGADAVHVMDISSFEGAGILHDLNLPVDAQYEGKFDVVFDSGTLEHIFDLPAALTSISRMIPVSGHVILMNPCSNAVDHGFYSISPTLYFDFFRINGFGDFSCYLLEGSNVDANKPVRVFEYGGVGDGYSFSSGRLLSLAFFATKQTRVSEFRKPMQSYYSTVWSSGAPVGRKSVLRRLLSFGLSRSPECVVRRVMERRRRKAIRYVGKW